MTEKKRVELTKTEDRILKAIKTTMNKMPEGRARRLHGIVCSFFEEQRQKVSAAMVRIFIEWMARERVLVEIARDVPAGDKVISILYEFNEEAYKAREFVVVNRRKVSPYEEGTKKKKITPVGSPEQGCAEQRGELKGFDIGKVRDGLIALRAEKQAEYAVAAAQLAGIAEEIARIEDGILAFEQAEKAGRELLVKKGA